MDEQLGASEQSDPADSKDHLTQLINLPTEVRIPDPLQTERLPSGRRILLRPLKLEMAGVASKIPSKFETDFSSIPRLARILVR